MSFRLAYYGTPGLSARYLEAIVSAGHDVRYVVTRPPKRRGRGSAVLASPVGEVAADLGIITVFSISEAEMLSDAEPVDVSVVVAYGRIIPPQLLDKNLFLNIHYSLLPKFRGAAPMERAILAGDEVSGVALMKMEEGLDTGPVFETLEMPIGSLSLQQVSDGLTELGIELLLSWLSRDDIFTVEPLPQAGEATYANKIASVEYRIEPSMTTGDALGRVRLGRGFVEVGGKRVIIEDATRGPVGESADGREPGAIVRMAGGKWGIILQDGLLEVSRVRPEGKSTMDFSSFMNGIRSDQAAIV